MDTCSLSHPRAITLVKDPIHDSIKLTCFDREIVDSKYFQRLHFVLQNSTTYVAFPSNKNSRFSHSLGVAHLCGEMLRNSLANSSVDDLSLFLENASKFINDNFIKAGDGTEIVRLEKGWQQTVSGQSDFRHRPPLLSAKTPEHQKTITLDTKYNQLSAGFIVDTLWQTLRLCGLAHDIGHLPMSHSLEGAIEKFKKAKAQQVDDDKWEELNDEINDILGHPVYFNVITDFSVPLTNAFGAFYDEKAFSEGLRKFPLHEKRSLLVLRNLMKEGIFNFDGECREYRLLLYQFAFLILFSTIRSDRDESAAEEDQAFSSFFKVMKLIVAGAVDGDRMDYTVRDGMSCGSTLGSFDLTRIVENAILYRDKAASKARFRIGFLDRGLSGIEQFFTQRHQGYKYLIYHRTSSRSEACLQELISQLLQFSFEHEDDELTKILVNFGYLKRRDDGKLFDIFPTDNWHLVNLEDSNLRTMLVWIATHISDKRSNLIGEKRKALVKIANLIDILIYRKFENIYDPLKHTTLPERLKGILADKYCEKEFKKVVRAVALSEGVREDYISKAISSLTRQLPETMSVIIDVQVPKIYDHERSKQKGEEVYLVSGPVSDAGTVNAINVTERSPTLGEMPKIFLHELKINCYFADVGIKKKDLVVDKSNQKSKLDQIFDQFLIDSYMELADAVAQSDQQNTKTEKEGD